MSDTRHEAAREPGRRLAPAPPRLSLKARTLLAVSLAVTMLISAVGAISLRADYREKLGALEDRARLVATLQADALAVPVWDFDDQQVHAILDALGEDPDVVAAFVHDPQGTLLARYGIAEPPGDTLRVRREIRYRDRDQERVLGILELQLSTARLTASIEREIALHVASLAALLLIVLASIYLAFRRITAPLDAMARVMARLAEGDHTVAVPAQDRADEIGAIARAIQVFKGNSIALTRAEERYRALYENAVIGIYVSAPDGRLLRANPTFVRLAGYRSEEEMVAAFAEPDPYGRGWYVDPERRREFARLMREHGSVSGFVSQIYRCDGGPVWVCENARVVRGPDGAVLHHEGTVEDVTERRRAAEEARLRVRKAVDSSDAAILIADGEGASIYLNKAFEELFGFDLARLEGAGGPAALFADAGAARELLAALQGGKGWSGEVEMRAVSGRVVPVAVKANPIEDEDGRFVGFVTICTDITERRRAEAQIRHMALHDALTGLPNRTLFRQRLEQALAGGAYRGPTVAALLLDLDGFKEVNDTLGHAAGDALIRQVAQRLRTAVRAIDTVARLGGDEFAIVQTGLTQPEGAVALARRVMDALAKPFHLEGHEVYTSASVGITVFPADAETPEQLLRNADLALYQAKSAGRGAFRLFAPELEARFQARRRLERDLRRAVAHDEFELEYQPIIALADGALIGVEALLRWRHPERGRIGPSDFVPVAEEAGLLLPIGEWVLRTACADARAWRARDLPPLRLAINLSVSQFRQDLAALIGGICREADLEPRLLDLELTESVFLRDTGGNLAMLKRLSALGVRISIDDFGTGYSSLSYLKLFPFDKVKIDRSFVRDVLVSPDAAAIVRAVIGLAHSLGMIAIAEGVESAEQLAFLRAEGCDEAQGFHLGRPVPASAVPDLVRRRPGGPGDGDAATAA